MGFFNFIETFFFFSLAISFILILLLVYHFKQRMTTLEQKSDTMVGIINDIAKELTYVKQVTTNYMITSPISNNDKTSYMYQFPPPFHQRSPAYGIEVIREDEDEDEDEDDEDEDENDEDDDEHEDEDDDDEDSGCDSADDDDYDENQIQKIVVSDSEIDDEIKIINLDTEFYEQTDHVTVFIDEPNSSDDKVALRVSSEEATKDVSPFPVDVSESTEVVDEPVDVAVVPEVADESEVVDEPVDAVVASINSETLSLDEKETYRKMTTQALKTVVASKELVSDPSKLKKYELLQLLGAGSNSVTM
jgi:hypothetical protein